eukprot:5718238-Amphidinium_carterae.1
MGTQSVVIAFPHMDQYEVLVSATIELIARATIERLPCGVSSVFLKTLGAVHVRMLHHKSYLLHMMHRACWALFLCYLC